MSIGHSCRRCGGLIPLGESECPFTMCREAYERGVADARAATLAEVCAWLRVHPELFERRDIIADAIEDKELQRRAGT